MFLSPLKEEAPKRHKELVFSFVFICFVEKPRGTRNKRPSFFGFSGFVEWPKTKKQAVMLTGVFKGTWCSFGGSKGRNIEII